MIRFLFKCTFSEILMRKAIILTLVCVFFNLSHAQNSNEKSNSVLLMEQVQYFNNQDVIRMTANVTADFKYYYFMDDKLMLQADGKKAHK